MIYLSKKGNKKYKTIEKNDLDFLLIGELSPKLIFYLKNDYY